MAGENTIVYHRPMKPLWVRILHVATAVLWLVIGLTGLLRGDVGFVSVAAAFSGLLGLIAAYLDRGSASAR